MLKMILQCCFIFPIMSKTTSLNVQSNAFKSRMLTNISSNKITKVSHSKLFNSQDGTINERTMQIKSLNQNTDKDALRT